MLIAPDILQVRSFGVNFYVIRSGEHLCLFDTGFLRGSDALDRALRSVAWQNLPVRAIILSHGHIDHVWNAGIFYQRYGAEIFADKREAGRLDGEVCGRSIARHLSRAEQALLRKWRKLPLPIAGELRPGEPLKQAPAFRVIPLPGHTAGHIGLWREEDRLLLCADAFASFFMASHYPPACFNEDHDEALRVGSRILGLHPEGLLPNRSSDAPRAS